MEQVIIQDYIMSKYGEFLSIDQLLTLGVKCSHCDRIAKWIASEDVPAYCDEHFPYKEDHLKRSDV
jgi:hypothetical protein